MPKTNHKRYGVSQLQARSLEAEFERLQLLPKSLRVIEAEKAAVAERIGWDPILDEFDIPGVLHWDEGEAEELLMRQLIGQVITTGMTVGWKGQEYLVVDLDVQPQELNQRFTWRHLEYWRPITIAPLKYFDLNA